MKKKRESIEMPNGTVIKNKKKHQNFNKNKKPDNIYRTSHKNFEHISNNKIRRRNRAQEFKNRNKFLNKTNDLGDKTLIINSPIFNKKRKLCSNVKNTLESDKVKNLEVNINSNKENMGKFKEKSIKKKSLNNKTEKAKKKKLKAKKIQIRKSSTLPSDHPDVINRTIYVGNVNINTKRDKIKSFFKKYGKIETVRLRGIPVPSSDVSKKKAIALKSFHPSRKSIIAYVKFANEEFAVNALVANGEILDEHHLIVDTVKKEKKSKSQKLAAFIGNLSFDIEEEDVWNFFDLCGQIKSVRIVRSSNVGAGKGFGFVCFESMEGLMEALKMDGKILKNRNIRIQRAAKKPKLLTIPIENEKTSILKLDKPIELRNKMERRLQKLKEKEGYSGKKSIPVKQVKQIKTEKKNKWKPLTHEQKKERYFSRALSKGIHTKEFN